MNSDIQLAKNRVRREFSVPFHRNNLRPAPGRPLAARLLYAFSLPVIIGWLLLAAGLNVAIPQLESVITRNAQSFLPDDASSVQAVAKMGRYFGQDGTNNFNYVLVEGDAPLGDDAHRYVTDLVARIDADERHVVSTLDLWSDPDFAPANESADGKSAFVLVNLAGNMGTALAMESTQAIRDLIAENPPPPGVDAHLTGPSAVVNDELVSISRSILALLIACGVVISAILLWVYRSPVTIAVPLLTVGMGMAVARAVVAYCGDHQVIGVSIFASALLSVIVLGAGTDYGVFLIGRYQEARRVGEDPERAYYTALAGTQHIILASGLTVAGATACMTFTRLAIFSTSGLPCTIGIAVTLAAALTLGPALLALGSRLGFLEPRHQPSLRRWRRIATTVVRWPAPVLTAALAVLVVVIFILTTFAPSFNERIAQPDDTPANQGFAVADRHFPPNIMSPSVFIVEADHDMRNPADVLALAKLTNAVLDVDGISNVQGITRPLAEPLEQGTLPNQVGYVGERITQITGMLGQRLADLETVSEQLTQLTATVDGLNRALATGEAGFAEVNDNAEQLQTGLNDVVGKLDALRNTAEPARQFVESLPNCDADELCQSALIGFSLFDDVDRFNAPVAGLADGARLASRALPQLSSQLQQLDGVITQAIEMVAPIKSTLKALVPQVAEITEFADDIGTSFAEGVPNDYFFFPSQAFDNPLFKKAMPFFFSADGTVTRMIVTPQMEGFSREAMDASAEIIPSALRAIKNTSLAGATVSIGGPGGTLINVEAFTKEDFTVSVVAAFAFVFCVVLVLLRSLVAAIAVIGTVALSYLSALGLSVFVWQHLVGNPLHWSVAPIAFTFLVAVGADYNMLLAARFKEEIHAGIKTGIIRSMVGTGQVVTTAGLVFGATMFAMLVGEAGSTAQIGTTVGIGLILDTLIVRSFIIPAIATLTGRWFWWPIKYPHTESARTKHVRQTTPA